MNVGRWQALQATLGGYHRHARWGCDRSVLKALLNPSVGRPGSLAVIVLCLNGCVP